MRPFSSVTGSLRRALLPACLSLGIALTGLAVTAPPAQARGDHFGIGIGFGGFGFRPWGPPIYYGPPVYYAPPPVYYPPAAPAYYTPNPAYSAPAPAAFDTSNCQPYHSTVVLGGTRQPVSGTACRQPDGTWRAERDGYGHPSMAVSASGHHQSSSFKTLGAI
jgi:hypothetical protein